MKTLAEALESGDPSAAVTALADRGGTLAEALREIAHATAPRLAIDDPPVPAHVHPYQALGAAAGLVSLMKRDALFPVAQAAWYLALSPRRGAHREHEARIVGEEIHLSKSLLAEIRAGNAAVATRLFNGLLGRRERVLLGDLFFQGAAEDTVSSGHKLSVAVLGWVLARQVGWSQAPALTLWPVVHYVASPPKDAGAYTIARRALGKAMVDLEAAGRNEGHVRGELAGLRDALRSGRPEAAAEAAVAALKSGAGGDAMLDEVSRHLAMAAMGKVGDAAWHALAFTHAARFVLGYSRSGHRLLPAIEAAVLAAAIPAEDPRLPEAAPVEDRGAALNEIGLAVEMGDVQEALGLLRGVLVGGDAADVVATLARDASKEDAHATGGHSLVFAHAALQEFRHSTSPDRWLALAALVSWLASLDHHREVVERLGAFA